MRLSKSTIFMLLTMHFLATLSSCDISKTAQNNSAASKTPASVPKTDKDPHSLPMNLKPESPLCIMSINKLVYEFKIPVQDINYAGYCDSYEACQAKCILALDDNVFTKENKNSPLRKLYDLCWLNCYTDGAADTRAGINADFGSWCKNAEEYLLCCDLPLNTEKTLRANVEGDRFCNAAERCAANCVLGFDCLTLQGIGPDAPVYQDCLKRCTETPEILKATLPYDTDYCRLFPETAACKTDYQINLHKNRFCASYPLATACANEQEYCRLYGEQDSCCKENPTTCTRGVEGASATTLYCDTEAGIADERCSPKVAVKPDFCPLVIHSKQDLSDLNFLLWLMLHYQRHRQHNGQDPEEDNYPILTTVCEKYPDEPYCRDPNYYQRYCEDWYPDAPECNDVYEPKCVRDPSDPDCRD